MSDNSLRIVLRSGGGVEAVAAPDALRRAQIEREREAASKPARDCIGTLR